MSLQVWLPLNGNLNNQGLCEVSISGTYQQTNGKVTEKAQSITALANRILIDVSKFNNATQFALSLWVKPSGSQAAWSDIFSFGSQDLRLEVTSAGGTSYTLYCNTASYSPINVSNLVIGSISNSWHHLVFQLDNKKISFYIDGVLLKSATQINTISACKMLESTLRIGSRLNGNAYNAVFNDIRIYDHCLSEKEIKELSKGLCLHYKLSRGGENLLFDTQTSSWLTAPYTYENSTTDSSSTKTMYTNNCTIQNEKTYTISFLAKKNENANLMFYIYDSSTKLTTHKINVGVNWEEVKINYTATLNSSTIRFRISNYSVANSELKTIGIKNIKLEEGDHATSWLPNKSDTLYSQLGYNNIEPDCSGCGNDGTINGTLTYLNDTPRYEGSSLINGSANYLYPIPDPIKSTTTEFTISLWFKSTAIANTQCLWNGRTTTGAAFSIFILSSGLRVDDSVQSAVEAGKLSSNTWYHVAVTWKSGGKKIVYINGVEKLNVNAGTLTKSNSYASIGRSSAADSVASANYFTGNISDFRIYATALSADDIKALYNNPISIDNNKNLHCLELFEDTNVSFGKSGVVKYKFIEESSPLSINDFIEN